MCSICLASVARNLSLLSLQSLVSQGETAEIVQMSLIDWQTTLGVLQDDEMQGDLSRAGQIQRHRVRTHPSSGDDDEVIEMKSLTAVAALWLPVPTWTAHQQLWQHSFPG